MTYLNTTNTRVWSIKNRAGPANAPVFQGCWKAGSITKPKAEPTIITCPDPDKYGGFKVVAKSPGEEGLATMTIMARYETDVSDLLAMLNRGCDVDIQVHMGQCKNPQDFNKGWSKILNLEAAQPGDWSVADFGALEQGDQSPIMEEMPFAGERLYEIKPMTYEEQAETEAVQEIIAIMICDAIECGTCDNPSDGCEKVFALTITVGGSPGARAEVIYTGDSGTSWNDTEVDTLGADEDPSDMACVGDNLVVISNDSDSLHWANIDDILAATETWAEVTTGFVAAGSPREIFSNSPRHVWIVGDGGYVYFTNDPTNSVEVQTAGTVTTEDLYCIHGYDTSNLVAGGNNNAIIVTRNGGDTWTAITGPAAQAAEAVLAVWMKHPDHWFIGYGDGKVYYTIDGGTNWTQKVLPLQSSISYIFDIKFSTDTVGWISAKTAAPKGYIYRTVDGGYTWYVVPEGNTSVPTADYYDEIAICKADPNVIFAGGLADDGTDGIIIKGS